ncbi:hypothetical protein M2165_004825 [Variovorax sp. TBS-050B]|nr:hypothetical protein [Variovorax sp. TBS-050B]
MEPKPIIVTRPSKRASSSFFLVAIVLTSLGPMWAAPDPRGVSLPLPML